MKNDPSPLDRAAAAAIAIAARGEWPLATLRDIAEESQLDLSELYGCVSSKDDIVDALNQRLDREAVGELELERSAAARERVFDAAMARFDAMEPHRAGLAPILKEAGRDPIGLARLYRGRLRTARWLLEIAAVGTGGVAGLARVHGFAAILTRVTAAWLQEESSDFSRTMRTLDRALRDVESWGERARDFTARRRKHENDAEASEEPPPVDITPPPSSSEPQNPS